MGSKNLESLAPEILLMILNHLPDLTTLGSLISASPYAFRLFNQDHAIKITESILRSAYLYSTRQIIYVLTLIRSSQLHIPNLEIFSHLLILDVMDDPDGLLHFHMDRDLRRICAHRIPLSTTTTVLRSILGTARRVDCMTDDCLAYYLAKFTTLKPQHPVDRKYHWHGIRPWEEKAERTAYPARNIGPPTWTECQRVSRGFWQLQVIVDVRRSIDNRTYPWATDIIDKVNSLTPTQLFYDCWRGTLEAWERWNPVALPCEENQSVIEYVRDVLEGNLANLLETRFRGQGHFGSDSRAARPPTEDEHNELINASAAYTFCFYRLDSEWRKDGCDSRFISVFQHVSFEPFRRLGFAFWDRERMAAFGLISDVQCFLGDRNEDNVYMFAWHSLLSEEEVTEQERQLIACDTGRSWPKVPEIDETFEDEMM